MIEIDFSFSGGLAGMDNAADAIITLGVLGPQPLEQTSGDPRGQSLFTGRQPPHHLQENILTGQTDPSILHLS